MASFHLIHRARLITLVMAAWLWGAAAVSAQPDPDLADLSIEQLMNVQVTSVSKKPQRRASVAEPIYVLTGEDIRRLGATTIPEALRFVPGLQVARISANQWAIGIRGFANRLARSVLVLIDGRTVYNPLFAGTYWELQDTILDDVERIEVIRGPGGSLWGANAFNGVINIITKDAADTQGGKLMGRGGTEEHGTGVFRYGGALGETLHYRAFAKYFNRDGGYTTGNEFDDWRMARGGFRADWRPQAADWLTLQGDVYDGDLGTLVAVPQFDVPTPRLLRGDSEVSGGNVLGRWSHAFNSATDATLQMYYDHTFRRDPQFRDERDTFEADFQQRWRFGRRFSHEIVGGVQYRLTADDTAGPPGIAFIPASRTDHLVTGFAQYEVRLIPDVLRATVGSKIEHNDYSGFEVQPNLRLLLTPLADHTFWLSIGRSVRTPSRIEHDAQLTISPPRQDCTPPACIYPRIVGNRDFKSEKLVAYQLGHRVHLFTRLFLDTVVFLQQYDDLLSIETGTTFGEDSPGVPHSILPLRLDNQLSGDSYGVEVSGDLFATHWWRLHGGYSYLRINLHRDSGSNDATIAVTERSSPHNQVFLRSELDLPFGFEIDGNMRWVDSLAGQNTDSYGTFDVRVAYRITPQIEVSAVGQNLWDTHHRELPGGTEVERAGYGQLKYEW